MNQEKEYLIENLSMLIASGMDMVTALESIKLDIKSKKMRQTIDQMILSITSGSTLWQALQKTRMFQSYVISFIKVGEETGKLSENLKIVIVEQDKQREFKSNIQTAVAYPGLVLGLTLTVGLGIAWFILPKLAVVFSQLKIKLPFITKILIAVGLFLGKYGFFAIPLILIAIGGIIFVFFVYSKTKFIGENFLFSLPIFNRLIKEIELSRFGFLLGTLLSSGISVVEGLESLISATSSGIYKKIYVYLKIQVSQGNSIQKSLAAYPDINKFIPSTIRQMLSAAEQSGHLSQTLLKIGQNYEGKIDRTTKNLSLFLEPVLLVIVWLGVLGVAIAVILPIYSLIGGINK